MTLIQIVFSTNQFNIYRHLSLHLTFYREFRTGTVVAEILYWYYPKMCYPAFSYNISTSSEKVATNWRVLTEVSFYAQKVIKLNTIICFNMREYSFVNMFYGSIFIVNPESKTTSF